MSSCAPIRLSLAGLLASTLVALSACDSSQTAHEPGPSASRSQKSAAAPEGDATLAALLARIPSFPPAPLPAKVALPSAPDRAAWISRIPTNQPVAFITIDDGEVKNPDAIAVLQASRSPVTMFLTTNSIQDDKSYFADLQSLGGVIESHTVSHPHLSKLGYDQQRYEICHGTDLLEEWYLRRPVLFRPPFGEKNEDTLRAASSCGLKAAFFWRAAVTDGVVHYQSRTKKLQPGDILVLHFRSTFAADFVAALEAIKEAGLTPALLEDYVALD